MAHVQLIKTCFMTCGRAPFFLGGEGCENPFVPTAKAVQTDRQDWQYIWHLSKPICEEFGSILCDLGSHLGTFWKHFVGIETIFVSGPVFHRYFNKPFIIWHERLFLGTFRDQLKWLKFILELRKFYWLNFMDWLLDSQFAIGTYEFWIFPVKIVISAYCCHFFSMFKN